MGYCYAHIALLRGMIVLLFLLYPCLEAVHAQRISFSTWTGSDAISVRSPQGALPNLNFNQKQPVILAGSAPVVILIADYQTVI